MELVHPPVSVTFLSNQESTRKIYSRMNDVELFLLGFALCGKLYCLFKKNTHLKKKAQKR